MIKEIINSPILLTLSCGLIVTLILAIVLLVLFILLNKKYKKFMAGDRGISLEKSISRRLNDIETLKTDGEDFKKHFEKLDANMILAYQKVALRKYDAFEEMGGHLSFSLCMLDANEDGFIISSMHTREGCYTYIKEVIRGEAFVLLSDEEQKTLAEAKAKKN